MQYKGITTHNNEVSELEMASETGGFTGNALHKTSITTEHCKFIDQTIMKTDPL
jgi:hypothetical protein